MIDAYIGEVRLFGFRYAPRNWLSCDGHLLSIQEYTALYSLIGDRYGGDGKTTFAVPDLRGRALMGVGQGAPRAGAKDALTALRSLQDSQALQSEPDQTTSYYQWGESVGAEEITLVEANTPTHRHTATVHSARYKGVVPPAPQPAPDIGMTPSPNGSSLAWPMAFNETTRKFYPTEAYALGDPGPAALHMHPDTVMPTGGGFDGNAEPHENRQPFLVANYCICWSGTYPQRP